MLLPRPLWGGIAVTDKVQLFRQKKQHEAAAATAERRHLRGLTAGMEESTLVTELLKNTILHPVCLPDGSPSLKRKSNHQKGGLTVTRNINTK